MKARAKFLFVGSVTCLLFSCGASQQATFLTIFYKDHPSFYRLPDGWYDFSLSAKSNSYQNDSVDPVIYKYSCRLVGDFSFEQHVLKAFSCEFNILRYDGPSQESSKKNQLILFDGSKLLRKTKTDEVQEQSWSEWTKNISFDLGYFHSLNSIFYSQKSKHLKCDKTSKSSSLEVFYATQYVKDETWFSETNDVFRHDETWLLFDNEELLHQPSYRKMSIVSVSKNDVSVETDKANEVETKSFSLKLEDFLWKSLLH